MRPVAAQLAVGRRRLTGEQKRRRRRVIDVRVRHRSHDRQLVGPLGQLRKVLADLDARHARGDRLELAADLGRRVGLQVPGVLLRRPAPHEEQDAALGAAKARITRRELGLRRPRPGRAADPGNDKSQQAPGCPTAAPRGGSGGSRPDSRGREPVSGVASMSRTSRRDASDFVRNEQRIPSPPHLGREIRKRRALQDYKRRRSNGTVAGHGFFRPQPERRLGLARECFSDPAVCPSDFRLPTTTPAGRHALSMSMLRPFSIRPAAKSPGRCTPLTGPFAWLVLLGRTLDRGDPGMVMAADEEEDAPPTRLPGLIAVYSHPARGVEFSRYEAIPACDLVGRRISRTRAFRRRVEGALSRRDRDPAARQVSISRHGHRASRRLSIAGQASADFNAVR